MLTPTEEESARRRSMAYVKRIAISLVAGATVCSPSYAVDLNDSATSVPPFRIESSVGIDLTYTDNAAPSRVDGEAEFVAQIKPAVRIYGQSPRLNGTLDFGAQQYLYSGGSGRNHVETPMSANIRAELVERHVFLDVLGSVRTQSTSVFDTQSNGDIVDSQNRTRVRTIQVNPSFVTRLPGALDLEVAASYAIGKASSGVLSAGQGVDAVGLAARLSGERVQRAIGWTLTADSKRMAYSGRPTTETQRVQLDGMVRLDPQYQIIVGGGFESDNFNLEDRRQRATLSLGAEWAPTERSKFVLRTDRRSFGNGYLLDLAHRTALTAWKFQASKDVKLPTQQVAGSGRSEIFDTMFSQLAGSIPDPADRTEEVLRRLDAAGIPANTPVSGSVLSSDPYLERKVSASVSLTGARNSIALAASTGSSERLSSIPLLLDDFALTPIIHQTSAQVSWSYKLSGESNFAVSNQYGRSISDDRKTESSLRLWTMKLTSRLSQRTDVAVSLVRTSADSTVGASYDENSITGSIRMAF